MRSLLEQAARIAFGTAIVVLLLLSAAASDRLTAFEESDRLIRHISEILADVQDLLLAVKNADLSSIEYALTGQDAYFESYNASVRKVALDEVSIGGLK